MRPSFSQVCKGDDRAGEVAGAAADLDLAPAGLAAHPNEEALVQEFDPAGAFFGLVGAAVETDDFAAAQPAGKAEQQDGAVAQAAQIVVEGRDHAHQIFGENGLLLVGRPGVPAADAAHHLGDVAVGAVERLAALGAVPGDGREPALDGAHRVRLFAGGRGLRRRGGEVEADHLRVRGQGVELLAPAPGGVVAPVGGIGALGGGGLGAAGVVSGGLAPGVRDGPARCRAAAGPGGPESGFRGCGGCRRSFLAGFPAKAGPGSAWSDN